MTINNLDDWKVIQEMANSLYHNPSIKGSNNKNSQEHSYYFMPEYQYDKENSNYYRSDFDVYSIRNDFPILKKKVNGKQLVWFDNAATTQKPLCMMNGLNYFYSECNSNIHRGAHNLAKAATDAYEEAREKVRRFIGASEKEEIIFLRGTTEAINLVAESYGGMNVHKDDEVVLTLMEHHSNIVPWQKLTKDKGAILKVAPINERGEVDLEEYARLLTPRTRIVSIAHVSNVLGTINPVKVMIEMAHRHGAKVLIDGAQSAPHLGVDVNDLDADFYTLSGHKLYGPTGIGVLYGKRELLESMPPWQRGGGMIKDVSFEETTYNELPYKFEAGTGNIADAYALGVTIDYIQEISMGIIENHEKELTDYAMEKMKEVNNLKIIGNAINKTSVISFVIEGISSDYIAKHLNQAGIAVRAGHHCAQPVLHRYGLANSVRSSFGIYNTKEEIDQFISSLKRINKYSNYY